MFYSHEILNNTQYGVATIWLVATVGKGNQKRLTKKAIQEVNVPKACEKILDPGAPLALRLQGNLLYGVSRVFAHQCAYVLTDAEKTQSDMVTFFRIIQTSETDPRAGKTKRQNIMLEDDPSFDPLAALPNFELLRWDKDLLPYPSQGSASKFSQMTPLGTASQGSSSPRHPPALINLQLPPSSQSAASGRIPSDFGNLSPLFGKSIHLPDDMGEFQPFGEDEFPSIAGCGLDFDGEGNLIGLFDAEPELPPLPVAASPVVGLGLQRVPKRNRGSIMEEEENLLEFGDDAQQVVEAIQSVEGNQPMEAQQQVAETAEGEIAQASARMARSRRPGLNTMLDTSIALPSSVIRDWSKINRDHVASNLKQPRTTTTPAQAKKNAMALLYEYGVAHVGAYHQKAGLVHPLASEFAGISLKARLQGQEPDEVEQLEPIKRGRRRKSDEAFDGEQEGGNRSTRPRMTEDVELGRGEDHNAPDDAHIMFDDNSVPEIGMDAAPPMEDRHSSSMMPWSRPGSAVPGSSVRGSAQKSKVAPSPLFNRGSALGVIDRHSDPAEPLFGMDDFGSQVSSFQMGGPVGPLDFDQGNNDAQASTQGLDLTSQNFLGYVTEQAEKTGVTHSRDPRNRRWIDFEELADPSTHTKAIAAQAFLHVLSLATKNVISVRQDGAAAMQPFGTLRIGVKSVSEGVYAESDDELA
ncbi:Meiotic recombination protein rec8 [Trichoderma ghanense]|uniref:Meiotic recombination protein rec8 n=1 Tax=Trichoderma ghanense TaxID=65468 RepID=A0ABY2H371_9HYPO